MRHLTTCAALGSAAILLAGCAQATAAPERTALEQAVIDCNLITKNAAAVGDDGRSLRLDGKGEESQGLSYDAITCVLDAVNTPDSTIAKIETTRALDGRQSDEWAGFEASWTYHPDAGLDIIIELDD